MAAKIPPMFLCTVCFRPAFHQEVGGSAPPPGTCSAPQYLGERPLRALRWAVRDLTDLTLPWSRCQGQTLRPLLTDESVRDLRAQPSARLPGSRPTLEAVLGNLTPKTPQQQPSHQEEFPTVL